MDSPKKKLAPDPDSLNPDPQQFLISNCQFTKLYAFYWTKKRNEKFRSKWIRQKKPAPDPDLLNRDSQQFLNEQLSIYQIIRFLLDKEEE